MSLYVVWSELNVNCQIFPNDCPGSSERHRYCESDRERERTWESKHCHPLQPRLNDFEILMGIILQRAPSFAWHHSTRQGDFQLSYNPPAQYATELHFRLQISVNAQQTGHTLFWPKQIQTTISLLVKCASVFFGCFSSGSWRPRRRDCYHCELQHNCWFVWYEHVLRFRVRLSCLVLTLDLLLHVCEVARLCASISVNCLELCIRGLFYLSRPKTLLFTAWHQCRVELTDDSNCHWNVNNY